MTFSDTFFLGALRVNCGQNWSVKFLLETINFNGIMILYKRLFGPIHVYVSLLTCGYKWSLNIY